MASEMSAVTRKSCAEEMALRPSRKPRILSATESAMAWESGRRMAWAVEATAPPATRMMTAKMAMNGGSGERDDSGVDEDFVVGQVARGEEERAGEDDGGGAEVEHALDGVDGDLGADGELDALGDERGADDVGEAAEESDGGEADELRADEGEGRDFLGGGEED